MTKPSPKLLRAVWRHAVRIQSQNEVAYRRFVEEARGQLPEHANDIQFAYIVRRIWMEAEHDAQAFWEQFLLPGLRSEYMRFDGLTNQSIEGETVEGWITASLVHSTLSVWQHRVPYRMNIAHALRMMRSTGRLVDLGVGA